ncbi:MAG: biotin transporter BioY [Candidatus Omnitrophota bacterium]
METKILPFKRLITERENLLARKILMSITMAAVTGLLAGIRIPLPFTPIPLTGQVLGVLLAGLFLEGSFAGLSQALYLLIGLSGIPWFSGWSSLSFATFAANPTSGYLVGFIPAAFLIGKLEHCGSKMNLFRHTIAFLAGILVLYSFGAIHLATIMHTGFQRTMLLAVYPFIFFDFLKALLAASFMSAFRKV